MATERQRAASTLCRQHGLRIGSVVDYQRERCVVAGLHVTLTLKRFRDGHLQSHVPIAVRRSDGVYELSVEVRYSPPATHTHVFVAHTGDGSARRNRALRAFIAERADLGERLENEHGTFYSRAAIARLTAEFEEHNLEDHRFPW